MYNRAELKSSDHRPVFALFRTTVWVVDQAKRDALARLLLENVTSTSNGEKLDEKLAALTLHPSIDDREYFDSVLGFFDLTGVQSRHLAQKIMHGGIVQVRTITYPAESSAFHRPPKSPLNRSSKRRLCCYGSGSGAVSVGKPIRLALGFPVVVFPFIIRRRAVHRGPTGPSNPCPGSCTCNREETATITLASEQDFIGSCGRI